jgi:hypothetical protein
MAEFEREKKEKADPKKADSSDLEETGRTGSRDRDSDSMGGKREEHSRTRSPER